MSTEEKSKANPRKPVKRLVRKKRQKGGVTRVLLVLFALLYLPALWNWLFHGSIETEILDSGLLEMKIPSQGVFIREETAIIAEKDGIIIPKVNSAERVPNKYEFAMLIDETSQLTLEKIKALEENIIRQVAESFPQSLDRDPEFRSQVQNEVNRLSALASDKNLTGATGIKASLERLLYQRNKEVFKSQGDRLYLQKEKEELEQLKQNLNKSATFIQSGYSGLVVWDDQPHNDKYSANNIGLLTPEDISPNTSAKAHKQDSMESRLSLLRADEAFAVSKDQPFARLVNNEKSWYVCVADSKKVSGIKEDGSLSLRLEELDSLIPCTVETVEPMGDLTKIVVSFDRMVEKTIHLRHVEAALVIKSIEGLKVPVRSLTNRNTRDNTADIILVRFNRAVIKRVTVVAEQDTFAVIDALQGSSETDPVSIFDIYVVNPQNIVEGQVIE